MHKVVKQKRDLSICLYNCTNVEQWNELLAWHHLSPKTLPQQLATGHSKSWVRFQHPTLPKTQTPFSPLLTPNPMLWGGGGGSQWFQGIFAWVDVKGPWPWCLLGKKLQLVFQPGTGLSFLFGTWNTLPAASITGVRLCRQTQCLVCGFPTPGVWAG